MKLSDSQSRAVQYDKGPLLVVAGPGSGKTRVIVERIAYLVKTGVSPGSILCLTFTNKATEEMLQRLEQQGILDVSVNTFHSFSVAILQDHVLESGVNISSGTIKNSAQLAWGIKNIDSFGFQHINVGNNAETLIRGIIDGIRTFKNELISPQQLKEYLDSKNLQDLPDDQLELVQRLGDLHKVYVKYQEFWNSKSLIDFNDMIVEAVNLLNSNTHIRTKLQEMYKHILIDEFQDNNYAQLELVKLISKDRNVTAVGDDDQCIFRFQGAYMKNFDDYKEYFQDTKTVNLNENYRSTQNIVSLATSLVSSIGERQEKNLSSENNRGEKIQVRICSDENAQIQYVVQTIKSLLGIPITREDGTPDTISYSDIAVLSRSRRSSEQFAHHLRAHGMPVDSANSENFFDTPAFKDVMAYLNVVDSPIYAGRQITRLLKNHGITEYNIARINRYADSLSRAEHDGHGIDFVLQSLHEITRQDITQKEEIAEFANMLSKLSDLSAYSPSQIVYKVIMSISGIYKKSITDDSPHAQTDKTLLAVMCELALNYEMIYPDDTLSDFITYINYVVGPELELPEKTDAQDGISVTTIHKSKGKEFQAVFIVDVAKDKLPLRFRSKNFYVPQDLARGLVRSEDEKTLHLLDEKRLLYVAMTRAKSHLYITYAQRYDDRKNDSKPSEFLDELQFTENPLIECKEFESTASVQPVDGSRLEQLKQKRQLAAVNSICQMNLRTAINTIVDLAKINHFEEFGSLDNFDSQKTLRTESCESHIDSELYQNPISLIDRENFRLSPSKFHTYKDCPLKFKFQHVLGVPAPPKTYFGLGTAIHSVIEDLTKLQKDGIMPTEELAFEMLEKRWNASLYKNQRTKESEDKADAKEMMKTYIQWAEKNPAKIVSAESKFQINIDGTSISGKIDRIQTSGSADYEVVDFKTGAPTLTKNTIKTDVQANIYALGVLELCKKLPKKVSLFYLKDDKIVSHHIEEKSLNSFKDQLSDTIDSIFNEEFDAIPESYKCSRCDYAVICDAKKV